VSRLRFAEKEPLHFGATLRFHSIPLFCGLHAFGGRYDAEAVGHRSHSPNDVQRAAAFSDVLDEGAIDLDLVEGEALQVAERRVSCAEIVHGDPDTELAQAKERVERCLAAL
jgi:hypothetical protein